MLIELFVAEILRRVGNENGEKGDDLVAAYRAYRA